MDRYGGLTGRAGGRNTTDLHPSPGCSCEMKTYGSGSFATEIILKTPRLLVMGTLHPLEQSRRVLKTRSSKSRIDPFTCEPAASRNMRQ